MKIFIILIITCLFVLSCKKDKSISKDIVSEEKTILIDEIPKSAIIKKIHPHADYKGPVVRLKLPSDENGNQPENVFIQNTVSYAGSMYSVEGADYLEIAFADKQVEYRVFSKNVAYQIESGDLIATFVIPVDSGEVVTISPDWKNRKQRTIVNKAVERRMIEISGCEAYAGMNLLISDGSNIDGKEITKNGAVTIDSKFEVLKEIVIYDAKKNVSKAVFYAKVDGKKLDSNNPNRFNINEFNNLMTDEEREFQFEAKAKIPRSEIYFYANDTDTLPVVSIDTVNLPTDKISVPNIAKYISFPKRQNKKEITKDLEFDSFKVIPLPPSE